MTYHSSLHSIDLLRAASRQLVRELGFTGGSFAGTDLSPSAVHALIEIEGGGVTARDLGARLYLEKSSVSRMLRKLIEAGDVAGEPQEVDGRSKALFLTAAGRQRVTAIHAFARDQVAQALGHLDPEQGRTVQDGLRLYADALAARSNDQMPPASVQVTAGYRSGLIARVTEMHALYYARAFGFGRRFEAIVAGGLAEFTDRLGSARNGIWAALRGEQIVGSVAIDGEDMGAGVAHLRWFIVDDAARGSGAGRKLLSTALAFVDTRDFTETHLQTFNGLAAARHLYEAHGFALAEENSGSQWGSEVLEQRFVRPRP